MFPAVIQDPWGSQNTMQHQHLAIQNRRSIKTPFHHIQLHVNATTNHHLLNSSVTFTHVHLANATCTAPKTSNAPYTLRQPQRIHFSYITVHDHKPKPTNQNDNNLTKNGLYSCLVTTLFVLATKRIAAMFCFWQLFSSYLTATKA